MLDFGHKVAELPCCVDRHAGRTVMADGLANVRTVGSPERGRVGSRSWPVHLVEARLAARDGPELEIMR